MAGRNEGVAGEPRSDRRFDRVGLGRGYMVDAMVAWLVRQAHSRTAMGLID